jgi:hypothetical protein
MSISLKCFACVNCKENVLSFSSHLKKRQFFFFDEKETKSHWHLKDFERERRRREVGFVVILLQTSSRLER